MSENLDNYMTLAEAAAYLRVSERTVRRRIETGELKAQRIGSKLMVYLPDAAKSGQIVDMTKTEVDKLKEDFNTFRTGCKQMESWLSTMAGTLACASADATQSKQMVYEQQKEVSEVKEMLQEQQRLLQEQQQQLDIYSRKLAAIANAVEVQGIMLNRIRGSLDTIQAFMAYSQQPFWRKLLKRKQLPPPDDVIDMEGEDG